MEFVPNVEVQRPKVLLQSADQSFGVGELTKHKMQGTNVALSISAHPRIRSFEIGTRSVTVSN